MNQQTALFHKKKPARLGRKLTILLLVLFTLLVLMFDINWFTPQINQNISKTSGSQININNIELNLSSPTSITLNDIKIEQPGLSGTIAKLYLQIDLWRLFSKELIVEQVTIDSPNFALNLEKLKQQQTETTPTEQGQTQAQPLPLDLVVVDRVLINKLNVKETSSEQLFVINNSNIQVLNLQLVENAQVNKEVHLPGAKLQALFENVAVQSEQVGEIKILAQSFADKVFVEQLSIDNQPSMLDLTATVYLPFASPKIELKATDNKLQLEQFSHLMKELSVQPQGLVKFSTALTANIANQPEQNPLTMVTGSFDADIAPGKLIGLDVNSALTALKDSQETSLLDIGGYLLTGPLGLIAGQLFDLTGGISTLGGETQINHLSIKTNFEQGVVDVTDTAIATDKYRLALKGKADIVAQEFQQFQFAILDQQGCADLSQTLNGPMNEPTSAVASNLLASVASPVTDIVSSVTNTVSDCEVFYSGVVQQP